MKALIFTKIEMQKFPIKNSKGGIWMPDNNCVEEVYWLQLQAQADCEANNIQFTIGEIEKKIVTE